jgi:hypothetical protein
MSSIKKFGIIFLISRNKDLAIVEQIMSSIRLFGTKILIDRNKALATVEQIMNSKIWEKKLQVFGNYNYINSGTKVTKI